MLSPKLSPLALVPEPAPTRDRLGIGGRAVGGVGEQGHVALPVTARSPPCRAWQ